MNKKIRFLVCMSLLLGQGVGSMTVLAGDGEGTDSTVSADTAVSPSKKTGDTTTSSLEEDSDSQSPSPMRAPAGTTLIEGVDIDADFATLLREDSTVQLQGTSWSGHGKGQDQLTVDDMTSIEQITVPNKNLSSLLGIEYAVNLSILNCSSNSLTELDVANNSMLNSLEALNNQLTELDVTSNTALTYLNVADNQLTELDVTSNTALSFLQVNSNQLTELDVTNLEKLTSLFVSYNQLADLNITNNASLSILVSDGNQLTELNITNNTKLTSIQARFNQLTEIDLSNNNALEVLALSNNQLTELDITNNSLLTGLIVHGNQLTEVTVTNHVALTYLDVSNNQLTELDVSNNVALINLEAYRNQLTELDVSNNTLLTSLSIGNNQLTELDVSNNITLTRLECSHNAIYDITSAFGLANLTDINASMQSLEIEMPLIVDGNTSIDLLKTTASTGLSVSNAGISGSPVFSTNGDIIELSNVSYAALANGGIDFNYSSADLAEGSSSASNKQFSGTIRFKSVSILTNQLISNKTKVASGDLTSWSWTMESLGTAAASNTKANLALPSGLTIDPASIKVNGSPGTIADIDGTNNLGSLNPNETIEITFNTTAIGNAGDWLEAVGNLEWEDSNTKTNQSNGAVQIKDDEQTFTPKKLNDMALLSTPESFRFGTWDVKNTAQIITLQSTNYLTNTQVVSDGFYTRLRDDRSVSTGWKLSAQLSEFKDSSNSLMPNSSGTSLRMEDVALENITDRDTPAEAINPSPIGTPSTVVTDETLVAGQTAKPLVTANSGEGIDTWQIRIPFNKVSLNLPANAGQRNTNYSATLTWSLDDTP